jgi:hypothetical protein
VERRRRFWSDSFFWLCFLSGLSLRSFPASDLGLGGRSILSMKQVAHQRAHLFACVMVCDFEPFTLCELAEVSIRLANDFDDFGNDGRFGHLTISTRVSFNVHASENTEATVSDVVETVSSSTANYGEVGYLKVNLNLGLRRDGAGFLVCHGECCQ